MGNKPSPDNSDEPILKPGAALFVAVMAILSLLNLSREHILKSSAENSKAGQAQLLPDLVPLPPDDIAIREEEDALLLVFSTTYYNLGPGPLELAEERGEKEDLRISQRIYDSQGTYQKRPAGNIAWNEKHGHYHFDDFVIYDLSTEEIGSQESLVREKVTFCIRDISRILPEPEGAAKNAEYTACGDKMQGVSVGWGDTYFNDYPGQSIDITEFPSGMYRLSFSVNPSDGFMEHNKENNFSSALLYIDKESANVDILEKTPSNPPEAEHKYK